MNKIKIEIPLDNSKALREAGEMLLRLSGDYVKGELMVGVSDATAEFAAKPHVTHDLQPALAGMSEDIIAAIASGIPPAPPAVFDPMAAIATHISSPDQSVTTVIPTPPPVIPTPPPVIAPNAELDGSGLPWDARINVSTKTKRQSDNTWKLQKGIDPALVESVKAELRQAMSAPVIPAAAAPVPPASVIPAAASAAASAPPAPPAPPVSNSIVPATFAELVQVVTHYQTEDKITFLEVNDVVQKHGLNNMTLLASRADLIPQVFADLEKIWNSR